MKANFNPLLAEGWHEPCRLGGACASCWAAGYCVAFAPASTQPPATCPLADPAAEQPARSHGVPQR